MTEAERDRLRDVARRRPLLDAMTVRRGKRKGEAVAELRPETRARLEAVGWERALLYKTMVLTGLRKGELASLNLAHVHLDDDRPCLELEAGAAKNREAAFLPLRADLAAELDTWLTERLRDDARRSGDPIPTRLPGEARLFDVPAGLIRIFDRDLEAAGIPKRDERGRTLDVHALRTTFGTLLSKGGVPLRTAQAAMRHSDPKLTANVYTDPKLLDVHGALDALPKLSGERPTDSGSEAVRATGTDPASRPFVAPLVALDRGNERTTGANAGNPCTDEPQTLPIGSLDANPLLASEKGPLTSPVSDPFEVCPAGLEPATFSSGG